MSVFKKTLCHYVESLILFKNKTVSLFSTRQDRHTPIYSYFCGVSILTARFAFLLYKSVDYLNYFAVRSLLHTDKVYSTFRRYLFALGVSTPQPL